MHRYVWAVFINRMLCGPSINTWFKLTFVNKLENVIQARRMARVDTNTHLPRVWFDDILLPVDQRIDAETLGLSRP